MTKVDIDRLIDEDDQQENFQKIKKPAKDREFLKKSKKSKKDFIRKDKFEDE